MQEEVEKSDEANNNITPELSEKYDPQKDVDILKSLVVCSESLPVFKEKLNQTRKYRAEMMKKDEIEIKEHFPYFLTHPMILVHF